jgi:MFS family permease
MAAALFVVARKDAAAQQPEGLSRRTFLAVASVMLVSSIGSTGLMSVMPVIGREVGIADHLVAGVFSLSALLWAVASPEWARLSDRWGRKPLILLGLSGVVLSMLGCGAAVMAALNKALGPLAAFVMLLLLRSTYGLLGSASATAGQAYVADRTFGQGRVKALSALTGSSNFGSILGPALAPFLIVWPLGLAGPLFGFGLLGCLTVIAVLLGVPSDRRASRTPARLARQVGYLGVWSDPRIRPFLVYGLVAASMQAFNTYTLGFLVIDSLGGGPAAAQPAIGQIMVCGAVAGLIAQWGLIGMGGMRPRVMLRLGALLAAVGNAVLLLDTSFSALLACFFVISLGYGLARSGYAAGAFLSAGHEDQAATAGAVSAITGASIALPPILAALLYQLSPRFPAAIAAASLAGLLGYALMKGELRNVEAH